FRRRPGAVEFLCGRIDRGEALDQQLAIEHVMRMPERSLPAAKSLLELVAVPDDCGQLAAIAIGNVAPWWPAEPRAAARRALAQRHASCRRGPFELAALSRSYTRAGLAVTRDLDAIEVMLTSDDPFEIEFALPLLAGFAQRGRPLLPTLRRLAAQTKWTAGPLVRGKPRDLPCDYDCTSLVREPLFATVCCIDPSDPAALTFYLELLPKAAVGVQLEYVRRLASMGTEAAPALPALTSLTHAAPPVLAREAVTALGMIGVREPDAIGRLRELADEPDRQLAMRARASLRQLGTERR
ncbi:MAG TPA: hypothetical protein VFZ65_07120, partial [Planctomycetota bacterium]|nr:hypothetical protein [Planctomycetota bacterium]